MPQWGILESFGNVEAEILSHDLRTQIKGSIRPHNTTGIVSIVQCLFISNNLLVVENKLISIH